MIFMTDPIIDKKMFGIEYLNAEGNSRKVAYDIRDALSKSCNHVELFENIEQLTTNIPKYKDWIVNTFLDNFFKVVFPILYWCLIS